MVMEGAHRRRPPLEVVSIRPALGIDTEQAPLKCTCNESVVYHGANKQDAMSMRLNQKNNSYLTHFLVFAFPSKKFKTTPGLLQSLLEATSVDLKTACCDGISVGDTLFHIAVLGMSGDMEYHAKTGVLNRSYQNVGHKNLHSMLPWMQGRGTCISFWGSIKQPHMDWNLICHSSLEGASSIQAYPIWGLEHGRCWKILQERPISYFSTWHSQKLHW